MNKFKQGILLCSSFVLLLGLFSTSFFTAFSSNASAVSQYDNTIRNTTSIVLGNQGKSDLNITANYIDIVKGCNAGYGNALEAIVQDRTGDYSISQVDVIDPSGLYDKITHSLQFTMSPNNSTITSNITSLNAQTNALVLTNEVLLLNMYRDINGSILCSSYTTSPLLATTETTTGVNPMRLFRSTYPFTPPAGYDGEYPNAGTGTLQQFIPTVRWELDEQRNLKAQWDGPQNFGIPNTVGTETVPNINWSVRELGSDEALEFKTLKIDEIYNYKFDSTGDYYLFGIFEHPGTPYAPFKADTKLRTIVFKLNVNGIASSGGSLDQECSISGEDIYDCGEYSPYEDCTTYGTNIGGYFQCIITNSQIWFKITMNSLFVPSTSALKKRFTEFSTTFVTQLGFLAYPFQLIGDMTGKINTALSNESGSGACNIGQGTQLFGQPFNIDMCFFRTLPYWNWAQPIIIGLTSFGLISQFFRLYRSKVKGTDKE